MSADAKIPRATCRLQFNEHFRLTDALALVPYLHELGISHVYASPLFKATPHSAHGYDVCDFNQLNPEIGTEADLEKLVHALHEKKMGLILDIVPNHMGIASPENLWWWDVLKKWPREPICEPFRHQLEIIQSGTARQDSRSNSWRRLRKNSGTRRTKN